MRETLVGIAIDANPFVRTAGQLMFTWSFAGVALEALTSHDKLKLGDKSLLVQHIARYNSGLSLARRKDVTCFLRWIMSVITDTTVQMCHQKAMGIKTMETTVSNVILNAYQSTGIEKEEIARDHGKLNEIRRFYNKKFQEGHDVHRNLTRAEDYSKPTKWGEYQWEKFITLSWIRRPEKST